METKGIAKQTIGFQKAIFNYNYAAATVVLDYSERMMKGFLKEFPWVTNGSGKTLSSSISFMKTARKDFKKVIDDSFDSWEKGFSQPEIVGSEEKSIRRSSEN